MNLLVANPTYHHFQFHYRVPEIAKALVAEIPAGSQAVLIPNDMNEAQIKEVIAQLQRYGAVSSDDVNSITSSKSLVFSVRKPVTENQINSARERDEAIRQKISDQETENAGVATIPTVLPPAIQDAMRKTQQTSTLHVEQIDDLASERPQTVKGGIDTTITVSKKAGAKERTRG